MAFPTTAQTDEFTYTAGALPGTPWPAGFGDVTLNADGTTDMVDAATAAWRGSYDNTLGSLADCEAWIVLNTAAASWGTNDEIDLHWRNQIVAGGAPSGNWKGYAIAIKATSTAMTIQLFKYDGTTVTNIGSAYTSAAHFSAGCKVGISHVGTTINVYTDETGGGWNQTPVITATDATYAAGWNGVEVWNAVANTVKIDKYGGGTVVTSSPLRTLALLGVGS